MKFRKNWKRFWTLDRHHAEGFTLVELIVVIAILAILAGVGTVGYSGYVKKANMTADKTLASEVANALQLHFYSQPDFEGVAAVILTADKASAGDGDEFADAAMTAAFGDSWDAEGNLALSYSGWGNGAAVAQSILAYFVGEVENDSALSGIYNGTDVPSFAADVDDLFVLIKDTAVDVGGKLNLSGSDLVKDAAQNTLKVTTTAGEDPAETFAEFWASSEWDNTILGSNDSDYNADAGKLEGESLNAAVANAAAIKARNTALAVYLRNQGYGEVYNIIANYSFGGNSVVPKDVGAAIFGVGDDELNSSLASALGERFETFETAVISYFGGTINGSDIIWDATGSQAYIDGLAYFAMMDTVNATTDRVASSDETYWDDLASSVSLYGSIARGEATLEQLNNLYKNLGEVSANSIVVTIMVTSGKMMVTISPLIASSGD